MLYDDGDDDVLIHANFFMEIKAYMFYNIRLLFVY